MMAVALATTAASIVQLLTIFYSLLTASLFVPIIAGLYVPRARTAEAMAAIVCGVTAMVAMQLATAGRGVGWLTPALAGITAASIAFSVVLVSQRGAVAGTL
jgi:SSS family solute:Na+ symporter